MPGLLTNKLGPLPTWGWLAAATGVGGAFYLYERHKSSTSGSGTTSSSTAASNVPDYVFQNYNEQPPEQSAPTTKNTGISRENRSPKVRKLEHKIYKTHQGYEKNKGKDPNNKGKAASTKTTASKTKPSPARAPAGGPATKPPAGRPAARKAAPSKARK